MRVLFHFAILAVSIVSLTVPSASNADEWSLIRADVFGDRPVQEPAGGTVTLYGPSQAADGALVPISIRLPTELAARSKALSIVIDRNPVPVAAVFHFGDAFRSGGEIGERLIETRIRIDSFSKVRAIVETTDGDLIMASKFIAGAGGCSALPSKDPDAALASLGQMKVKLTTMRDRPAAWREGVVMLRHPNFTGMQMNPQTKTYTPARFVSQLSVTLGEQTLFRMDGGISLSENPHLRFIFSATSNATLTADGIDSDGTRFSGHSAPDGS